jgi:hypothetical protein
MQSPLEWLRARRRARTALLRKWEVALAADPGDPEGSPPILRLLERQVTAALATAGFLCHRRAPASPFLKSTLSIQRLEHRHLGGLYLDILGSDVEVWLSGDQSVVGIRGQSAHTRIENVDARTPEDYARLVADTTLSWVRGERRRGRNA